MNENINEIFNVNRVTNEPMIKEYDFSQLFNNNINDKIVNINEYVDNKSYGSFETPDTIRDRELHQNNINEILNTRKMLMRQARVDEATKVDLNVDIVTMEMFYRITENRVRKIKEQILRS